jgi:glycosyltransferase involved in cell wall biosynthesis
MAKLIHDNLNAGGGSERLAIATIELLNEMGFIVDVETCNNSLEVKELEKFFGHLNIRIRQIKQLDIFSLFVNSNKGTDTDNDCQYDLIINTHGDLLPYISERVDGSAFTANGIGMGNNSNSRKPIRITYCHHPLVPYYLKVSKGEYKKFLNRLIEASQPKYSRMNIPIGELLSNAPSLYYLMINNTIILTNSEFSKKHIKHLYNAVEPITLSPPVDVQTFRKAALYSKERQDIILVLSRISPDKEIENAIRVAKILSDKKVGEKMIIVGNLSKDKLDYLLLLNDMIIDYGLKNYVKLEVGVSFEKLLSLISKSKVYLHPLAGEPFGISVAEAMAAGLIPIVPNVGGNSEFVPEQYHYRTLEEAAEKIQHALLAWKNNNDNAISEQEVRINLSNLVFRFSIESYKNNLRNIISSLVKEKEITLLNPTLNTKNIKQEKRKTGALFT